jgi:Ca2+-binding RTX toxin-like protein
MKERTYNVIVIRQDMGAGGGGNSDGGVYTLTGSNGNDTIWGDADDDVIDGGVGDDLLIGGNGLDFISGGDGNDTIWGNWYDASSNEHLEDEHDSDLESTEQVHIDDLNEDLYSTTDILFGGNGDDQFFLGGGELATGGEGVDIFSILIKEGRYTTITDFDPLHDKIEIYLPNSLTAEPTLTFTHGQTGEVFLLIDGEKFVRFTNGVEVSNSSISLFYKEPPQLP